MRLCVYDIDHKYALQIENTGESDPDTSLIHSFISFITLMGQKATIQDL